MDSVLSSKIVLLLVVVALLPIWRFLKTTKKVFSLDDRVVVITGAGNGIGKKLATKIYTEAARVTLVLLDIDYVALQRVSDSLCGRKGSNVRIFKCDVSDDGAVNACIKGVLKAVAPKEISVLVNNAGVVSGRLLVDLAPDEIRRTLGVNTLAHFWMVKAVLPSMKRAKDGMIISISSIMGLVSSAGLSDYCASKAAVVGFHDSLRLELWREKSPIRTLLVCPSYVDTGMFDGIMGDSSWNSLIARLLTPALEEDDVVFTIYDAIVCGKKLLVFCSDGWRGYVFPWIPFLNKLLPLAVQDWLQRLAGGMHGMDTFAGRKAKDT